MAAPVAEVARRPRLAWIQGMRSLWAAGLVGTDHDASLQWTILKYGD